MFKSALQSNLPSDLNTVVCLALERHTDMHLQYHQTHPHWCPLLNVAFCIVCCKLHVVFDPSNPLTGEHRYACVSDNGPTLEPYFNEFFGCSCWGMLGVSSHIPFASSVAVIFDRCGLYWNCYVLDCVYIYTIHNRSKLSILSVFFSDFRGPKETRKAQCGSLCISMQVCSSCSWNSQWLRTWACCPSLLPKVLFLSWSI